MPKKSKTVEVTDPNQALAVLGHTTKEDMPDSGLPDMYVDNPEKKEKTEPEKKVEEPVTPEVPLETPTEPTEPPLSDADRARLWQSNHDKLKLELDAKNQENELMRQYVQSIMNNQSLPQSPEVKGDKEPILEEYIDANYDPMEALDPRTYSGRLYAKYQQDREAFLRKQARQDIMTEMEGQNKLKMARRKAQKFADAYPQFKNVITGEPEYKKIENFLQQNADPDNENEWVDWMKYLDFKAGKLKPEISLKTEDLEKKANMPSSVASATSATPPEVELSQNAKTILKYFGRYEPIS